MGKLLKKEYTLKITVLQIISFSLASSIIYTVLLYYFIKECGTDLTKVLNWVITDNTVLDFSLIMFPVIFIILVISKLSLFVVGNAASNNEPAKPKKSSKKELSK